jgi:hypothetical protein
MTGVETTVSVPHAAAPRFIFHIGMGKTGTTSIQHSLLENLALLRAHGVDFLGHPMEEWQMGDIPAEHRVPLFIDDLISIRGMGADECRLEAREFAAVMRRRQRDLGVNTFLLSHETIFELLDTLAPFFEELQRFGEVTFILYVRDPHAWLPSAYAQWELNHKVNAGPVRSFAQRAPELIAWYDDVPRWQQRFGTSLIVRSVEDAGDVVADFAGLLGVPLAPTDRVNDRLSSGELVLRALHNTRLPGPALPAEFDQTMIRPADRPDLDVEAIARIAFDTSELTRLVEERAELFAEIARTSGFVDFPSAARTPAPPAREQLLSSLVGQLAEVATQQAVRLAALERRLDDMARRLDRLAAAGQLVS